MRMFRIHTAEGRLRRIVFLERKVTTEIYTLEEGKIRKSEKWEMIVGNGRKKDVKFVSFDQRN